MSKEILDDLDWDDDNPEDYSDLTHAPVEQEVVMLKTFSTENEAQMCAATLRNSGIDAHVVSSATGQMTPFAYGNVRLFIAESQMEEALEVLQQNEAENQVYDNTSLSAVRIIMLVVAILFIFSVIVGLVQIFSQKI